MTTSNSDPTWTREPNGLTFHYLQWNLSVRLAKFRESRSTGASAEITIRTVLKNKERILTQGVINLSSMLTREKLAKRCEQLYQGPLWNTVLEQVSILGLRELRQGERIVPLIPTETDQPAWFALNPLLYDRQPMLLYGLGDSGKSMLGLYWALLLATGGSENNLACASHAVLYLDWELNASIMASRIRQLQHGQPHLTGTVHYRRCVSALADDLDDLQTQLSEQDIDVLIIDSVGMAAGMELEKAETAIRFFNAIRALNRTALIIGHTAKNSEDKTPFGSVFFFNLARSVWEIRKVQEAGSSDAKIGLYHKKCNVGALHAPLGFQLRMSDEAALIEAYDLTAEPILASGLPLADQIKGLLKDGTARTIKSISELVGAKQDRVRTILHRYKGKRWYRITGESEQEAMWTVLEAQAQ